MHQLHTKSLFKEKNQNMNFIQKNEYLLQINVTIVVAFQIQAQKWAASP